LAELQPKTEFQGCQIVLKSVQKWVHMFIKLIWWLQICRKCHLLLGWVKLKHVLGLAKLFPLNGIWCRKMDYQPKLTWLQMPFRGNNLARPKTCFNLTHPNSRWHFLHIWSHHISFMNIWTHFWTLLRTIWHPWNSVFGCSSAKSYQIIFFWKAPIFICKNDTLLLKIFPPSWR
jgi:hypothetical protein